MAKYVYVDNFSGFSPQNFSLQAGVPQTITVYYTVATLENARMTTDWFATIKKDRATSGITVTGLPITLSDNTPGPKTLDIVLTSATTMTSGTIDIIAEQEDVDPRIKQRGIMIEFGKTPPTPTGPGIQGQIDRITGLRNQIKDVLVDFGLVGSSQTKTLEEISNIMENIPVFEYSGEIKADQTLTLNAGYYKTLVVKGTDAGGGTGALEDRTVTPSKVSQNITVSDPSKYYGLRQVTVNAIPNQYQDLTNQTAEAADVLSTKYIINKTTGATIKGTIPTVTFTSDKVLDTTTTSYTIANGYHPSGTNIVKIVPENKGTIVPTKSAQTITPSSGKVISGLTVGAIPAQYGDVTQTYQSTPVNVTSSDILNGKVAITNNNGVATYVVGNVNSYTIDGKIDGLVNTSYSLPNTGYYTSTSKVSLTDDIENALKAV